MPPVADSHSQTETESPLGLSVPLTKVERELKSLFASDQAVTRASLTNFAIYSEEPESLARNTELIREVTREHACRAILIAVEPEAPELSVRAWVTAHCNLAPGGGKSVCSEQIAFLIQGRHPYLVSNIVFSRLDSDLPLVLWWQGAFSPDFEPALYSRIDRLIIDSGAWEDPLSQFAVLEEAYHTAARRFNVMDLMWTRILKWRLAVAALFDEPAALAKLPAIDRVCIRHGDSSGHALAARMFAAWMAHQAGWKLSGATGDAAHFQSKEGAAIRVEFSAVAARWCIDSVELASPDAGFDITRIEDGAFLSCRCPKSAGASMHLLPAGEQSPAQLVIERLRRGCNNKLYFRLLQTVRGLLSAARQA